MRPWTFWRKGQQCCASFPKTATLWNAAIRFNSENGARVERGAARAERSAGLLLPNQAPPVHCRAVMKPMNFKGRWVLVTGASSGLGAEMARQLAREHGANLVLVARRQERLAELQKELGSLVRVETIVADLSDETAAERVVSEAESHGPLYAAVLNAGATHFGHHDELSWEQFKKMLDLNVVGTVALTTRLIPLLEKRRENGGLLLIASLAGLTPVSYQAAYSGTKGFLVNYGCSLHHEMRPRGVTVTVFAPGGIATEMTAGERFNDLRNWLVPVGPCAREAIFGLKRRRYLVIPGIVYGWGARLTRFVPQSLLVGRVAAQYRNSLLKNTK